MLFIGIALPVPIGIWLIRSRRADLLLSLLGLAALPLIVWGASLGAKIGPCKVDGCMSSTQHSRLVFARPGRCLTSHPCSYGPPGLWHTSGWWARHGSLVAITTRSACAAPVNGCA